MQHAFRVGVDMVKKKNINIIDIRLIEEMNFILDNQEINIDILMDHNFDDFFHNVYNDLVSISN